MKYDTTKKKYGAKDGGLDGGYVRKYFYPHGVEAYNFFTIFHPVPLCLCDYCGVMFSVKGVASS